jgi:hypothetical protein
MPLIDSLVLKDGQIIARVRLDRTEIVRHGDVFPHFEGVRYRALGAMTLVDGPDGEWRMTEHVGVETRIVEVVVRRWDTVAALPWSSRKRRGGRGPNGAPSSGP